MKQLRIDVVPWKLRTRTLETGRRTLVMGIVNITPDSFSDGGRYFSAEAAVAHALACLDDGADLLDLGAESTRPGSQTGDTDGAPLVSASEEQDRLLPVVEGILRERPDAILSIDTYKASTARAALQVGAEIINDVSGLQWDAEMAGVCALAECGVVLMHTRGRPEEWVDQPELAPCNLMALVRSGLDASLKDAQAAGIRQESIILDPGYGFGKRFGENYALLARQPQLLFLGRPLLVGVSRKSFLGRSLAPLHGNNIVPPQAREIASIAAMVGAILQGASIVRVHAVRPALEAARVADEMLAAGHSL